MINSNKLEKLIKQQGLKKGYIAERLGISRATFCALLNGKTEFKVSQIRVLCEILGIQDDETLRSIFFA